MLLHSFHIYFIWESYMAETIQFYLLINSTILDLELVLLSVWFVRTTVFRFIYPFLNN